MDPDTRSSFTMFLVVDQAVYEVQDGNVTEVLGAPEMDQTLHKSGIITFTDSDLQDVHTAELADVQDSGLIGALTLTKVSDTTDTTDLASFDPTASSRAMRRVTRRARRRRQMAAWWSMWRQARSLPQGSPCRIRRA